MKKIKMFLSVLFTLHCKEAHYVHSIHAYQGTHNRKITNSVLYLDRQSCDPFLHSLIRKRKPSTGSTENKIRCTPTKKEEEEDAAFGIELENLVKDLEEGKYGDESLNLYREVERRNSEEEEKEAEGMKKTEEQIDMHDVEGVINNTDDTLKTSVRKAFYNTDLSEQDSQDVKREYNMMKKIEKTFDDIDDMNYPKEKLNMKNVLDKISSMKDSENSETPFKDTAKTLMKYKGLLHMPYEQCRLLNGDELHWRESLDHIELNIPIFEETDNKHILFQFGNDHIKLEVLRNGNKVLLLNHKLCGKVNYGDAYWVITGDYKEDQKHINLVIPKMGAFKYIWEKLLQDGEQGT
ncbi:conserved Plasmodium protein, unknown function [Plasmodium knowlesi strain H]|uniref:CS domain-containing protein n=3 Tax=Plasmodium knowlesi TaxID=5850 RepID=A0A5K1VKY6_PLAKH|nr:HSP20-like chaperone, putative [Plasmodium knowlesi strain H]OTN65419.1 Uncharacterized protein PKNOH_S110078700 [Plasmodium knowlesi]CAA9989408.1 HSP20-like chaperone, putative [Plasmodium knowlesi strain H]SBO25014.1 conserved Plasmodium protein, unknown function [Plasmodium knowlesi strain H]SBO27864.1 conserved Plasmodium protein, unknown function [Plasmodium knowlesi strain H]VVS78882.1 HSP20-like chaperone, putative [Plasmodium knowlesi strain H]|eukprot:XP_002260135.1 hypothetical protein, conserved in Plasmodium species [Plasmodium knowlesi strain H]